MPELLSVGLLAASPEPVPSMFPEARNIRDRRAAGQWRQLLAYEVLEVSK
jgi:hypothetical protein